MFPIEAIVIDLQAKTYSIWLIYAKTYMYTAQTEYADWLNI